MGLRKVRVRRAEVTGGNALRHFDGVILMVNAAREPLHGEVEVDDTWIGGPSRRSKGADS